jgi:hypothetical protein
MRAGQKMPRATKRSWKDILQFSDEPRSQSTVRRYYAEYRREMNIPERCDNEDCVFFTRPLVWNGKPFRPILDHENGVRSDNRPKNLRYLCPNCDAQVDTRGGKNKGRVEVSSGGYSAKRLDGRRDHTLVANGGEVHIT